jgi:hypothetical protein
MTPNTSWRSESLAIVLNRKNNISSLGIILSLITFGHYKYPE